MPDALAMRTISRVVSEASTSPIELTSRSSSTSHSYFFATQGMMDTQKTFSGSRPFCFLNSDFTAGPNICCGDLEVDSIGIWSG